MEAVGAGAVAVGRIDHQDHFPVFDHVQHVGPPNLKEGLVSVIDMKDWKVIKEVKTAGAAFFMRSHENTPYAWVDAMMSPTKDTMQLLDKRTLEVAKTLRPEPGKIAAHTEFTRDGKYALVSIWENDGALVIYDTATFQKAPAASMPQPSRRTTRFISLVTLKSFVSISQI